MHCEIETDVGGVVIALSGLVAVNYHDARRDPAIRAELLRRCGSPDGWRYELDRGGDRWSTFAPLRSRAAALAGALGVPATPIVADCEDLTAAYGAALLLADPSLPLDVAVTQPGEGEMAHAYLLSGADVLDYSVRHGMRAPGASYYRGPTKRVNLNRLLQALFSSR